MAFENIKKLQQAQQVQTTGTPAASTSASNSTTSQPIDMKSKTVTEEQKIQVMVDFLNSGEYKNCPDEDKAELLKQKFPNLAAEELNKYVTAAKTAIEEKEAQKAVDKKEGRKTDKSEEKEASAKKEIRNPKLEELKNKLGERILDYTKENGVQYAGMSYDEILQELKRKKESGENLNKKEKDILRLSNRIDKFINALDKNSNKNEKDTVALFTKEELQSDEVKNMGKREKFEYFVEKFLLNNDEDYANLPDKQKKEYLNTQKDILEAFLTSKDNNTNNILALDARTTKILNYLHVNNLKIEDLANDEQANLILKQSQDAEMEEIQDIAKALNSEEVANSSINNKLETIIEVYVKNKHSEAGITKTQEELNTDIDKTLEIVVEQLTHKKLSECKTERQRTELILQATIKLETSQNIHIMNTELGIEGNSLLRTSSQTLDVLRANQETAEKMGDEETAKYLKTLEQNEQTWFNFLSSNPELSEEPTCKEILAALRRQKKAEGKLPPILERELKKLENLEKEKSKKLNETFVIPNGNTFIRTIYTSSLEKASEHSNNIWEFGKLFAKPINKLTEKQQQELQAQALNVVQQELNGITPENIWDEKSQDKIGNLYANAYQAITDPDSEDYSCATTIQIEAIDLILKNQYNLTDDEIADIKKRYCVEIDSAAMAYGSKSASIKYAKENITKTTSTFIYKDDDTYTQKDQDNFTEHVLTSGTKVEINTIAETQAEYESKEEITNTEINIASKVPQDKLAYHSQAVIENLKNDEDKEYVGAAFANSGYEALLEGAAAASDSIDVPTIREQYESMIKQASQNYPPEINKIINEVLKSGVISEATRNNSQPARNSYYPEADRYVEIINKYYNNSNSTGNNNQTSDNRSSNNVGNNYNTQENTYSTPRQTTYEQPVVQNHNEPIISQQTDYSTPDIINTVRYTDSGVRSTLNSFDTHTSNSSANGSTSRYNPTVDATGSTPSTYSTYSTTPTSSTSYVDPAKVEADAIAQQVAANEDMKELAMANVEEVKQAIDESIAEWELKQQLKLNDEVIEELKQAVVSEAIEDVISTSKTKKRAIFEKLSSANSVSEVYDILLSALGTKVHEKFINRLAKAGSVGDVHAFIKSRAGNTDLIKQILMKTSSISLKSELIALLPDSDVLELLDKNLINTLENVDHQVIYTYVSKNIYSLTQTNFANYLKYLPFDEREKLIEMRNKAFGIQPENAEAEAEVEIAQSATEAQAPQQNGFGNAFAQTNPVTQSANPMTQPEQNPLASKPKKADNSGAEAPQTKFKAGETTKTLSDGRVITNQGTTFAGVSNNASNDEGFRVVDPKEKKQKEGAPIGMNDEVLTPGSPEWLKKYNRQAPTTAFTMAALDDDMDNDGLNFGSNRVKIGQPIKKKYNPNGFNVRG